MVVAQLETSVLDNQQAGGDAEGQAEDIDKGKAFVFKQVPESDGKKITNHKTFIWGSRMAWWPVTLILDY